MQSSASSTQHGSRTSSRAHSPAKAGHHPRPTQSDQHLTPSDTDRHRASQPGSSVTPRDQPEQPVTQHEQKPHQSTALAKSDRPGSKAAVVDPSAKTSSRHTRKHKTSHPKSGASTKS